MMFDQNFFSVKTTTTTVHVHNGLQRQNAWSEKDLTALMDMHYSKDRQ